MEEITNRWAGLKLSERERNAVDMAPIVREQGFVLAGKFCTKRRVNLESVARVLKTVWRTEENFELHDMGENKVLFQFGLKEDLDKVLLMSPWSFDKYILLLHKLEAGETVTKVKFDRVSFWVQVHGLPTMYQTKDAGRLIGETLGKVEKVDVSDKGFCMGSHMRVRVMLEVSAPLCRGRLVCLGGSEPTWVDFKYERLPIFCYWCGMIDHDERDCLQQARSNVTPGAEEKQYGPWLRATPELLQKPQLVVAKGEWGARKTQGHEETPGEGAGRAGLTVTVERMDMETGSEVAREEHVTSKVTGSESLMPHLLCPIPENLRSPAFEKQIREIDEAILGGAVTSEKQSSAESDPVFSADMQTSAQSTKTSSGCDLKDEGVGNWAGQEKALGLEHGPSKYPHLDSPNGKLAMAHRTIQDSDASGQHSPKCPRVYKNKQLKGPTQRNKKGARRATGKDKIDVGAQRVLHGKEKKEATSMIVETCDVGIKRKERSPVEDLSTNEENGKKQKLEEGVMALGKIMAEHFGSASAVEQPRREQ